MSEKPKLSERQIKILEMIREYTDEYGYPPTIREIGEAVGISSTSVVSYNLNVLERKRHLARGKEISRGLRLLDPPTGEGSSFSSKSYSPSVVSVPLLGVIAAGEPIPVPDSDFPPTDSDSFALTPDIVPDAEGVYALEVRGNSMIDALINDGDIVIMRHQRVAANGEMIAAWLKDEKSTTLKRFYLEPEEGRVRLEPANPTMEPIYVDAENIEIQGKVIGVVRRLG